ncbi:ataxin-7-like protein 2 isoform X1 [Lepisosteus oculatus]|nr:PREDICTED: ataxin-7-like protein 2 isoform X1 [Lepisosteus oculatus]
MAVRERAAAVMAALERRFPSLDDFAGQSWSSWVERAALPASEGGGEVEECGKSGRKRQEAMTLRKEDMSIFGHCPAHDDFYLVVCGHCSQVVKPQAFEKHCEKRHGPLGKLYSRLQLSPSAPPHRSRLGHPPSLHGTPRAVRDRPQGAPPPRAPPQPHPPVLQQRNAKGQREGSCLFTSAGSSEKQSSVSLPDSSSVKPPPPPESPQASPSPSPRDTPPKGTPPSEKQLARRGEPSRTPETLGALSSGQKNYKKASRKECDLDKHCGVMDPERKKLCTRLLTCNIHSIHQRRKVPGRTKSFDLLVAELKNGARTRERGVPVRERPSGAVPSPETPGPQLGAPHGRGRLANCTAPRSWASSESGAEEDSSGVEPQGTEPMSPPQHSRLSSEESEGEGLEEPSDWSYSPWHPKPLGVCSFGSHALGRGIFTFDRRLHRLRAALSSMVERHLNSHLWKKIPQAADLQSPRTSAPHPASSSPTFSPRNSSAPAGSASLPSASPLRTSSSCLTSSAFARETRPQPCPAASPSPGTACGPPDSVGGGGQSITSPLPANTPSPSGPSRAPTPAGKASKPSRQKERPSPEHVTSSRKRKRQRPPLSSEDPPSHERNCVAQERGRTPVSVSSEDPTRTAPCHHGPINGSLSPGKPRPPPEPPSSPSQTRRGTPPPRQAPPPDPSSRGRGASPSMHSKAVSYDHKGLGKKRKSGTPPSPAEPRAHKPHRTPHSPHASLFPWKKDGRGGGGLAAGLERKLGAQKPNLHH